MNRGYPQRGCGLTPGRGGMPVRVVSLSPNTSMILFALGLDGEVVGVTDFCPKTLARYMEQRGRPEDGERLSRWERLPMVGRWLEPDWGEVRALRPTLVVGSGSLLQPDIEALGLPADRVRYYDTRTLADLYASVGELGGLVGRDDAAAALVAALQAEVDAILATARPQTPRPRVYHERCICITRHEYANPEHSVMAAGHLSPDLVGLAGGDYLLAPGDETRWLRARDVVDYAPDVILLNRCGGCPLAQAEDITQRPSWRSVPAIREHRVYKLSGNPSNPNLLFPAALRDLVAALESPPDSQGRN